MPADDMTSSPAPVPTGKEGGDLGSDKRADERPPTKSPAISERGDPRDPAVHEGILSLEPVLGSVLAHYRIEERIGGGAMTAVFRARDSVLDRTVALKVLLQGADPTTRERFRREARTAAMLEHPNIVRTYQVGELPDSGLSYIAMEYVKGPSLAEFLQANRSLNPGDAAALLEPIARALAYAHGLSVVHRDVKPSNILLQVVDSDHPLKVNIGTGGTPVAPLLSDFGIARALDAPELTSAGRTIGTPAYMAPEQCVGADDIDGRADIYSLGAVLYRCLVGKPPFVGSTTQILHAHVYDAVMMPYGVLRSLPEQLVSVLKTSMAKGSDSRYASAMRMAEELAACVHLDAVETPKDIDEPMREVELIAAKPASAREELDSSIESAPASTLLPAGVHAAAGNALVRSPRQNETINGSDRSRRSGSRGRLGVIVLSVALVALTAMLAVTLFSGVLPAVAPGGTALPQVGSTVAGSPDRSEPASATLATITAPAALDGPLAHSATPRGADEPRDVLTPTRGPRATPTVTPTAPPLEVALDYAWDNAQAFYAEQSWDDALTWLIAVEHADPEFETEAVAEMLAETYAGLALRAIGGERYEAAVEYLSEAVNESAAPQPYTRLRDAVAGVVDANAQELPAAQRKMQAALASFGAVMADDGDYCRAADLLDVALQLSPSTQLRAAQSRYADRCALEITEAAAVAFTGRILYSAVEGGRYGIYMVDTGRDAPSSLIIADGSQPSLSPDGSTVAYFSRRPDTQGLSGFPLGAGLGVDDRGIRYSSFVEDARDSPPRWNPQSDRLVYASDNFGDGRSRIYLTWADGTRSTVELGLGKDPAWHPREDVLVFNGTDETGNNPGLWTMRTDGTDRKRLTDNGNDQRPVWTPDGSTVVFMSNGRHDNWDLYRVDVATRQVVRLTDHVGQDGLPSVSPDGRHVAYVSDREGYWRLWTVPLAGGEASPLASIVGELPKWLEHSVQWTG